MPNSASSGSPKIFASVQVRSIEIRDPQPFPHCHYMNHTQQRATAATPLTLHQNHKKERQKHTYKNTYTGQIVEGQGTQPFQVITHIEPHNGRTFQNISFFTTTRIVNLISLLNWRAFLQLLLYCFILLLIISETAENKTLYLYLQREGMDSRKIACILGEWKTGGMCTITVWLVGRTVWEGKVREKFSTHNTRWDQRLL